MLPDSKIIQRLALGAYKLRYFIIYETDPYFEEIVENSLFVTDLTTFLLSDRLIRVCQTSQIYFCIRLWVMSQT